jgi:hypothetical protein
MLRRPCNHRSPIYRLGNGLLLPLFRDFDLLQCLYTSLTVRRTD